MGLESGILQDARGFTPEKDEQAGDTSSPFLSPWSDFLNHFEPEDQYVPLDFSPLLNHFEPEDQHAPLAISTAPSPGSDPISPYRTRDLVQLCTEFQSRLSNLEALTSLIPSVYPIVGEVGQKVITYPYEHDYGLVPQFMNYSSDRPSFINSKEKLQRLSGTRSPQTYSSGSTDYAVKGYVGPNRYQIDALPDTGAKRNFVAQQLVDKLGLVPKAHTKETFRLPSGATIKSSGTVDVPFTFLGESEHHLLDCCILPKCTHDLILCQAFLKATDTLTKFAHRITKSLRRIAPRFRFNLIEDDTCCLQGNFDDTPSVALADTGCDAMLISADFARRHSLEVDKGLEHRHVVEYADGSLDITTGIVRDTSWQFRSSWDKIPCDFYVLEDLKADIVLSSHFIFQHDVFSQFEEDIIDMSLIPGRDFGDLYNIRLISHYSSALQSLEASSIADMNSPGSFGPAAIKAERVRRDQIRDAINALPPEQQDQARIDERNRQEIWDGYRRRHSERQEGDTDSTQQVLVVRKQRWWQKGLGWQRLGRRAA